MSAAEKIRADERVRKLLESARSKTAPAWRVELWRKSETANDNGRERRSEVRHG